MSDSHPTDSTAAGACPPPFGRFDRVRLGHGSGGRLTSELIEDVFLPVIGNPVLNGLEDAAIFQSAGGHLAMTTDSYVVNPIFFPGGDIGSLSVHGTVNDLSMRGARPLCLSVSFILEEGLAVAELQSILRSFADACRDAEIRLVTADTKVVNRGAADRVFINTTGIGICEHFPAPGAARAEVGDAVIVSGQLGRHGMAIMCSRQGIDLESAIVSDSAPLFGLVSDMFAACPDLHCLRDLTRGGLSSAVNELAAASLVGIELIETAIPIDPQVRAACEILGLDPLYVACEGRLVAVVPPDHAEAVVAAMKSNALGTDACLVGRVVADHRGRVVLKSQIGGHRILDKLSGEQLPRIC